MLLILLELFCKSKLISLVLKCLLTLKHQVTLSFDNTGFTGNVTTTKDGKNRVIRGRRVGTRPVSGASGTALSLGKHSQVFIMSLCDED